MSIWEIRLSNQFNLTVVSFCVYRFGLINGRQLVIMSDVPPTSPPPPYCPPPNETKAPVPPDQTQQPQPGDYYPQQLPSAAPTAPYQTAITYYAPIGPQQPQQQQPVQLLVTQAPLVVTQAQPPPSFVLHIVLSCVVLWCCAWPCGLVAFILASKWNTSVIK